MNVDSSPPFFASDPPPLAARGLASILIALVATAALLATLVEVPESLSAPFVLVPLHGTDPVRAPRAGTIAAAFATEGQLLAKGAPLFSIRSASFADRTSEKGALEAQLRGAVEGLANERSRGASEDRAAVEDLRTLRDRALYLEKVVSLKREQDVLAREQAERAAKLRMEGLASLNERADAEYRQKQTAMELAQLEGDRQANATAIKKLTAQESGRRISLREKERAALERMEELRIRLAALATEPLAGPSGELAAVAPCDGAVVKLVVRAAGAVVREGDVLGEVACSGEALRAQLSLAQVGLVRVRAGQTVKLLLDALPYQRYGVRSATVGWVSPSAIAGTEEQSFPALADLDEQTYLADGLRRPLQAGMRGTARVVIGRRTVLRRLLEPLRRLREELR